MVCFCWWEGGPRGTCTLASISLAIAPWTTASISSSRTPVSKAPPLQVRPKSPPAGPSQRQAKPGPRLDVRTRPGYTRDGIAVGDRGGCFQHGRTPSRSMRACIRATRSAASSSAASATCHARHGRHARFGRYSPPMQLCGSTGTTPLAAATVHFQGGAGVPAAWRGSLAAARGCPTAPASPDAMPTAAPHPVPALRWRAPPCVPPRWRRAPSSRAASRARFC